MKECSKCKEIKKFEEFNIDNKSKDGYRYICKSCTKDQAHERYVKNKNRINEYNKNWHRDNKEKMNIYYSNMKEHRRKIQKEYREKNKKILLDKKKIYYIENKEEITQNRRNKRKEINEYSRKRKQLDPILKLISNIRTSIYNSIKRNGFSKNKNTKEIIGCSFEDFKYHLESKFEIWMNWNNYGKFNGEFNHGWDIDHIIPISTAKTEEDIIKLNHFLNLQPLCSKMNRVIKKDKLND